MSLEPRPAGVPVPIRLVAVAGLLMSVSSGWSAAARMSREAVTTLAGDDGGTR